MDIDTPVLFGDQRQSPGNESEDELSAEQPQNTVGKAGESNRAIAKPKTLAKRPAEFPIFHRDYSPSRRYTDKQRSQNQAQEARRKVEEAYQLCIEAAGICKDNKDEQSRILSVIELFRAYKDDRTLPTATAKLEKQVSMLETSVSKLTKLVQKENPPKEPEQQKTYKDAVLRGRPCLSNTGPTKSTPSLRAATVEPRGVQSTPGRQDTDKWTTIERRKATQTTYNGRVVLAIEQEVKASFNAITLRNSINQAFSQAGHLPGSYLITGTKLSDKGNLVLTPKNNEAKKILLENLELLRTLISIQRVLDDSTWHKVVVHGIDTITFRDGGESLVRSEIETFNKGLKLVTDPIWLTKEERRLSQPVGSMLLTFLTEEEAKRAKIQGLWVGAKRLRVEKALDEKQRQERRERQDKRVTEC